MKRLLLLVVLVMAVAMQVSLLPAMRPFGVVPNLLLGLVLLLGLRSTVSWALILAVAGGVVMDLSSGADFGLHTGILVLAALITGLVRRSGLTLVGPLILIGLVTMMTVLSGAINLTAVLGSLTPGAIGPVIGILTGELVLNLILTLGARPIINWLVADESALPAIG